MLAEGRAGYEVEGRFVKIGFLLDRHEIEHESETSVEATPERRTGMSLRDVASIVRSADVGPVQELYIFLAASESRAEYTYVVYVDCAALGGSSRVCPSYLVLGSGHGGLVNAFLSRDLFRRISDLAV